MTIDSAYQLMFSEYPDIVTVPQMCKMLGGISLKTGYRLLKKARSSRSLSGESTVFPKSAFSNIWG